MIRKKTKEDISGLQRSGEILVSVLDDIRAHIAVDISLGDLDALAAARLQEAGAKAAFLGYQPAGASVAYPAHICTSVNEQVVHGIPGSYTLRRGDVLSVDIGVIYEGYVTDAACTVVIGEGSARIVSLVETARRALFAGIEVAEPGGRLGDIGWHIARVTEGAGFHVIKGLAGHGVGFKLHEDPTVLNYGSKGTGLILESGMVLALEPMIALESDSVVSRDDDSYVTEYGDVAAHMEATIAITDDGPVVLTPHQGLIGPVVV